MTTTKANYPVWTALFTVEAYRNGNANILYVCHFRAESLMEDSMDTNAFLFTMENHYRDPAGTTVHAKTVLLCCVDH